MREVLISHNPEIDSILEYLLDSSGKMLRPRMVYLAASLAEYDEEIADDIAAAVELIHMASLVHDDVIDEALTRRGKQSVNSRWGNKISVLCGDYLFAAAFKLVNKHNLPQIMDSLTETIQVMCSGEIKQLSMLHNLDITEEDYYDKTYRKTACLFASSCKVGALTASMSPKDISLLEQYGLSLGYAYQIIDDVLDFVSDTNSLGKPVGNDLLQGNITLPVIIALRDEENGLRLRQLLQEGKITAKKMSLIMDILNKTGGIEESVRRAQIFLQVGMGLLDELSSNPAVQELKDLSLHLIEDYYQKLNISNPEGEVLQWKLQSN